MIGRFQGVQGESDLRWLLREQVLVRGAAAAADELAFLVQASEFSPGKQLYLEGDEYRRQLYIVLGGRLDLLSKGNLIASLERGQFFGEFPLLDSSARYSVTVVVAETACIATIEWAAFTSLADKYPVVWRNLASELALRLRRQQSLLAANKQPEEPKSLQEAIVRMAWSLPKRVRVALAVLAAFCITAYFTWSSLPDAAKSGLFLNHQAPALQPSASAGAK